MPLVSEAPPERTGGRGARLRILDAATELFYGQGINATGIEELATRAHVSKRTLYQHFAGKDALVAAYLTRLGDEGRLPTDEILDRRDLPARERLLGIFEIGRGRGCPYVNAAVELCDTAHPARRVAGANKAAFIERLVAAAREAGAGDPEQLGHQLAVLSDGAGSQAVVLDSTEPLVYARAAAAALIDLAVAHP